MTYIFRLIAFNNSRGEKHVFLFWTAQLTHIRVTHADEDT